MPRLLLPLALLLLALLPARAQLDINLQLKRRIFLRGESIEAQVSIHNLSGHDITLSDTDHDQWFGFQVMRNPDIPVGPLDPNYRNPDKIIQAGETVERTVDLVKLFPINEHGSYKVRATVYFNELGKYLTSRAVPIDISEGKTLWHQTVGVPDAKIGGGQYRDISLISFQCPDQMMLYARVEDQATANVLATYPLGRILGSAMPMCEFNDDNTLYAMHMTAPSEYALSKIGVNGEWLGQSIWVAPTGRATVRKRPDGEMVVGGASRRREEGPGGPAIPKLSDRPAVVPPVVR